MPDDTTSRPGGTYSVAAMGFSILGGLLKGMADVQAGNFNAEIARRNAHLADLAGGDALLRGQAAAASVLMKGSALQAKQKAAIAGAGASVSSGSALDVLAGTDLMSELDAKIIENNAAREAWGFQNTAANFRQKAAIDESAGRMGAVNDILGGIQGAATVLGGIKGAATYGSKPIGFA